MVRWLFTLFVALLSGTASAVIPVQTVYTYSIAEASGPDLVDVISSYAALRDHAVLGCDPYPPNATYVMCNFSHNGTPIQPQTVYRFVAGTACPANSTLAPGSQTECVCDAGYTESADQKSCEAIPPPEPPTCNVPAGTVHSGTETTIWTTPSRTMTICYDNCVSDAAMAASSDGEHYVWGPFTSTGEYCTGGGTGGPSDGPPGPPPPDDPPPTPCAKGTCPGTVNGTTVCLPCDTTESKSNSSGSSSGGSTGGSTGGGDSGGSTGGGDSGGDNGSSGGTWSQNKYTTCSGDKCSTTTQTTTTGSDGTSSTKTETKEEPKEDFCTANPKSPHCVEGTFGGACSGGFQCSGDAVQCAIAKEQHIRWCQLNDTSSEEYQLYQSKKGGSGNVHAELGSGSNDVITLGPQNFNSTDIIGGGSGLTDKNVTVWGKSITLPFSNINPYLSMLGNVLLFVSYLVAARIVTRG